MQGSIVQPLSPDHHDEAVEQRLIPSADRQWPIGSAILLMVVSSTLLWLGFYFAVRELL